MTQVTLLYVDGCPQWRRVDAHLRDVGRRRPVVIEHRRVDSLEEAERLGFAGSPTVLVDGRDPFPADVPPNLGCRLYRTEDGLRGVPSTECLRQALPPP